MNKKTPKRACMRKVIPRHFTKKRSASLSEILRAGAAASNARRIKELLRNNRALASALQESHCTIAASNAMLQNYARDANQVVLARNKIKEIALTFLKLVEDIGEVSKLLDISPVTINSFSNNVLRMRIPEPDLDIIEESPRSSIIEDEEVLIDSSSPSMPRFNQPVLTKMPELSPSLDSSMTEIYNVKQLLVNTEKQRNSLPINEVGSCASSPVIQTPPTPQFDAPVFSSELADFAFEKPKEVAEKTNVKESTSKSCTNPYLSKIPVRRPNLFQDLCIPDSPEAPTHSVRRETFVVDQLQNNDSASTFARRGTFTLQDLANELKSNKKADSERRGTFVIPHLPPGKPDPAKGETFVTPHLPPPKPDSKPTSFLQLPQEICTDDQTRLLSEDMDLTEIIPSCGSKIQFGSSCFPPTDKNAINSTILPSILNASKPISPIERVNPKLITSKIMSSSNTRSPTLEENKVIPKCIEDMLESESGSLKSNNIALGTTIASNPLYKASKQSNKSENHEPLDDMNAESTDYIDGCQKSLGRASGKSVLPISPEDSLKQKKSSSDLGKNESEASNECRNSKRASRKSVLPNHPKETLKQLKLSDKTDLETINECRKSKRASRKSVLPNLDKEVSNDPDVPDETGFEAIKECKKSGRASKMSLLPNDPKETNEKKLSNKNDLEAKSECRKSSRTSRKSVLPDHAKKSLKQKSPLNEDIVINENDLEAVNECKKHSPSRETLLPNSPKEILSPQSLSDNPNVPDTAEEETKEESKKSYKRSSRKSVLPSKKLSKQQSLSLNEKKSSPDNASLETIINSESLIPTSSKGSKETEFLPIEKVSDGELLNNNLKRTSSSLEDSPICPRKPVLRIISDSSMSNSFSDEPALESEPEVITPEIPRKRIPGRFSLKPNRRGPFIFKNNTKSRKSISKANKLLDSEDTKKYEFSSSEEEDEVTKKPKPGKKPPRKSSKMKNKTTVAVLERDIGLKYQEQGRKKRSLKRKVSFVNLKVTSIDSEGEEKAQNSEKELEIPEDVFLTNDDLKNKNAPVRRSILKKPSTLYSNDKDPVLHESSFSNEDENEQNGESDISSPFEIQLSENLKSNSSKISGSTSSAKITSFSSGKSNCKNSDKKDEKINIDKRNKIGKQINVVEEDSVESDSKVGGEIVNSAPTVSEDELKDSNPLPIDTVDKLNLNNKSSLKAKEKNSLSKLSHSKSHKNSEFFGFENKRSKSKRTFSGVSERSSKKRITATDDFLEEVDIVLPGEKKIGEATASDMKSLGCIAGETDQLLINPETDGFIREDDIAYSKESKKSEALAPVLKGLSKKPIKNTDNLANSATVDFVEVNVAPPNKTKKNEVLPLKSPNKYATNTDKLLKNTAKDNILDNVDSAVVSIDNKEIEVLSSAQNILPKTPTSENTCNKKTAKSKKSSNARAKKTLSQPAIDVLTENKHPSSCSKSKKVLKDPASTPPSSKARKTGSTENLKENTVIPDLELEGRSRRSRPAISFKEPSLNKKMRRE